MGQNSKITLAGLIFTSCLLGGYAHGQNVETAGGRDFLTLAIAAKGFPMTEKSGSKELKFSDLCASFGATLVKNKGLWATGPFSNFICSAEGQTGKDSGASDAPWQLTISAKDDIKNFLVTFKESPDAQPRTILSYDIEGDMTVLSMLSKKSFSQLLAFYISSAMPFRSAIPSSEAGNGVKLTGRIDALKNLTPPDSLDLFDAGFKGGVWTANRLGEMAIKGESGGKITWTGPGIRGQLSKGYVFVQLVQGREELLRRVDQMIKDESGGLLGGLLSLGKSAYVGARYGVPFGGQGVMKSASMIGIFADLRSGVASGVKINYDLIPAKTSTTGDGVEKFAWSRFQLGYSFLKSVNWGVISRIDATPKLGVTTLDYDFTPAEGTDFVETKFKMSRAPTVGLEFGMEKNTKLARIRAWSFASFSVGILPLDKDHSTTSTRVGLDAYRDLFKLGSLSFAILGFGSLEQTKITKKSTTEEVASGLPAEKTLSLRSFYAGGGATLTW
jgi:hypothetical protein